MNGSRLSIFTSRDTASSIKSQLGKLSGMQPEMEPILKKEAERMVMKKLRTLALEGCGEEVRAFAECASGRMFSVAWKCRAENNASKACMEKFKNNEDLKKELRRRHAQEFPKAVVRYEENMSTGSS